MNIAIWFTHARASGGGFRPPPHNPKYPSQTLARLGASAIFCQKNVFLRPFWAIFRPASGIFQKSALPRFLELPTFDLVVYKNNVSNTSDHCKPTQHFFCLYSQSRDCYLWENMSKSIRIVIWYFIVTQFYILVFWVIFFKIIATCESIIWLNFKFDINYWNCSDL